MASFIHVDRDFLLLGDIALVRAIGVRHNGLLVGAGNEPHASALHRGGGEGDPG